MMKYMHFQASCAYTALAMLLEERGIDTEDTQIAQEMGLPWLFSREGETFLSGPMLQGLPWFDLWLRPRGLIWWEKTVVREEAGRYLRETGPAMLGIQTPYGKHAVVYVAFDGTYHFLNPTHEGSGEEVELLLDDAVLREALDPEVVVGRPESAPPETIDRTPLLRRSLAVLWENVAAIEAFASVPRASEDYLPALDTLFRPLLLDGITMLELAGEKVLSAGFRELQGCLMRFLRGDRIAPMCSVLPLPRLRELAGAYAACIERELQVSL